MNLDIKIKRQNGGNKVSLRLKENLKRSGSITTGFGYLVFKHYFDFNVKKLIC